MNTPRCYEKFVYFFLFFFFQVREIIRNECLRSMIHEGWKFRISLFKSEQRVHIKQIGLTRILYFCAGVKKPLQYSFRAVRNSAPKGTGLTKGAENYIWSETNFLEKRKTSYVGSSRSRNAAVARPKPVNKTDPNATIPAVQFEKGPSPDCGHSNRILQQLV